MSTTAQLVPPGTVSDPASGGRISAGGLAGVPVAATVLPQPAASTVTSAAASEVPRADLARAAPATGAAAMVVRRRIVMLPSSP